MVKGSPIRVVYIGDDKQTARHVEERLTRHGIAVSAVTDNHADTAIQGQATYDVLCVDLAAARPGLFHGLRERAGQDDMPPTIVLTEPGTAANAGELNDLGPVCCLVRDRDGRYLDALPRLVERLSATQALARAKQAIEKALRETEERLFISQRSEAIGMLAGGIAHDLNNVLATILGYASFLKGKVTQDDIFFSGLTAIEESVTRADELTSQILALSRGGKPQIKTLSINRVIGDVYKLIRKTFDKSIRVMLDLDEHIDTIQADTAQMKQMMLNLSINARDAMPKGGMLTIKTFMSRVPDDRTGKDSVIPPGEYVGVSISDTGAHMDEVARRRMVEPHSSKKGGGSTAGFGLSIVYGIVKGHGGWIDVNSEIGGGNQFVILLPASKNNRDESEGQSRIVVGGSETILVIDDETQIVKMLRRLLTDNGYRVLSSDSSAEGVRIFEEKGPEIDLVLLDIMMPGMGGKDVMGRLLSLRPDVKILLISGYSQQDLHRNLMDMGAAGFIGKPFVMGDLLIKIRDVLG